MGFVDTLYMHSLLIWRHVTSQSALLWLAYGSVMHMNVCWSMAQSFQHDHRSLPSSLAQARQWVEAPMTDEESGIRGHVIVQGVQLLILCCM